ncbi:type II toxin-antitoxin system RelE family toxin [Fusobacterium polymorphum]
MTNLKIDLIKRENKKISTNLKYIKKLENSTDPKAYGKQLSGNLAEEYSFRVSDYRILAIIEGNELKIYAIKIGHRSKVYDIQEIQYNLKK